MLSHSRFFALFACLSIAVTSHAKIIRVPADQQTIQGAITSALSGDTVVVYPGTYFENIRFGGRNIVVTSRFYETGDLNFVKETIINGSRPVHSDTASCVLIINGEDSTAVLQGFTITGGGGTKWVDEHGAGTYREGGGILVAQSAPTIRYNLIINNEATNTSGVTSSGGGGIRAGDGNVRILNNVVAGNKGRYGAGIVLNYTGATVKNNILTGNSGGQDYGGGALWMNHDGATGKTIENNTIEGNSVLGVYVYQGSSTIRNCIIWGNSVGGIGVRSGGPSVTYSDVQGGWTGKGNINLDPGLVDTTFHLQDSSPCVDAGDSTDTYNDDALSTGDALPPSRGGARNDMGAYGGPGADEIPWFGSLTSVKPSRSTAPSGFRLEQNFPNPFNPTTVISFQLAVNSHVMLKVYDALGRELATLMDGKQSAGLHAVKFDGAGFPSGVYFYKLTTGGFSRVGKMMLVK